MLDCIVLGTGPSLKNKISTLKQFKVPLIGLGSSSQLIEADIYFVGDPIHLKNIPINGQLYTTEDLLFEVKRLHPNREIKVFNGKHDGTSGGCGIALAATLYKNIGIIGFDGVINPNSCHLLWYKHHRLLLNELKSRVNLISLMDNSVFQDLYTEVLKC